MIRRRGVVLQLVALVAAARVAHAAPAPDAVVRVFAAPSDAPPAPVDAAIAQVRADGLAVIDERERAAAAAPIGPRLADAQRAYDELRFADAAAVLDGLVAELDGNGAQGASPAELEAVLLLRGFARAQLGGEADAWDDYVAAAVLAPTRVLDPERVPPRAIERFARAQATALDRGVATLTVERPAGCAVWVDGAPLTAPSLEVAVGAHWVRGACADRAAAGRRIDVVAPASHASVLGPAWAPPSDDEVLTSMRLTAAPAVVVVAVHGQVAHLHRLTRAGLDTRRAIVDLASRGAEAALAQAMTNLATPRATPDAGPAPSRWRPLLWAGLGAAVVAAVLVPLALRDGGGTTDVVVRPTGLPAW